MNRIGYSRWDGRIATAVGIRASALEMLLSPANRHSGGVSPKEARNCQEESVEKRVAAWAMKFGLIDRIVELARGERIVAVKAVSLSEEYLADHFPTFPVLPGVLMLEALAEAAAWLVRDAQDFSSSIILLRQAKNVTYKNFVKPGDVLTLTVTCRRLARDGSDFDGTGHCNGTEVVRARFGLRHFSLSDGRDSSSRQGPIDQQLVEAARAKFALLRRGLTSLEEPR